MGRHERSSLLARSCPTAQRRTNGSGQRHADVPGRAWDMEQLGWEMLLVAETRPELSLQ